MSIIGGRPGAVVFVPTQPLLPGTRFPVRADVPAVDPSVRGGTLRFGYAYSYLDRTESRCTDDDCPGYSGMSSARISAEPHTHTGRPYWTTGWHEVVAHDLFGGPPAPVSCTVELTVPADAPPSVADMLWWQVRAELDIVRARDPVQPAPLVVLPDPESRCACLDEDPRSSDGTRFEVVLERNRLHRGGTVGGTLTYWPDEAVRTRGVTVRLVREVEQRQASVPTARQAGPATPITGEFDLVPGMPFQVPFQATVPPDAAACCVTDGFRLHWVLELDIEKKRRLDETIRVPVSVA